MPFQEPFAQQPLGTARPKIWRAALPLLPLAIRNTTKITEVSASAGGRAAAGKFRAFRGIEALPTLLVCACPHQRPTTQAGGSCGGSEAEPAPPPATIASTTQKELHSRSHEAPVARGWFGDRPAVRHGAGSFADPAPSPARVGSC